MVTKDVQVKTVLLFVCAAVFAAGAEASLYNDPAAMTGFTGRASFDISQSGLSLRVDVEYAVYAPGTYPGQDLTGGSQYIYAYQVFNSNRSNVAVDFFSVEIISGASANLIYADDTYGYGSGSGIEPSSSHIFAQSAGFIFASQNLDPRKWSDVLIFTSVDFPTTGIGTVSGGGLSGMETLVSPVPEPATILFIGSGLLISTNRKKHLSASKNGCRKIMTIK